MRFAGTRMESFLGDENRPDFGNITESALAYRNKEDTTYTDLMGQTAATGIAEAGKVEAAGIVGAAQASAAQAQGQASIMEGIGGIASSAIGAFGNIGGGGASSLGGSDFNATDAQTMGVSEAQTDWLSTPGNYAETVIDGNGIGPTSFKTWDF